MQSEFVLEVLERIVVVECGPSHRLLASASRGRVFFCIDHKTLFTDGYITIDRWLWFEYNSIFCDKPCNRCGFGGSNKEGLGISPMGITEHSCLAISHAQTTHTSVCSAWLLVLSANIAMRSLTHAGVTGCKKSASSEIISHWSHFV